MTAALSREVMSILAYLDNSGVPHRVTATLGRYVSPSNPCSPHTARSLHCAEGTGGKGLAVDFAAVLPGVTTATVAQMAAIWRVFEPLAPKLAELFFNGPGITKVVKNGVWRDGLATLGVTTWTAHKTHVHVAVPRGVFLTSTRAAPVSALRTEMVPIPVHDFEEASVKQTMMVIGKLDANGCGWSDWNPGLGRDPNIVGLTLQGPSPPDDNSYWMHQAKVQLSAQPRGGAVRVTVRGGQPGDTITCWVAVS